MRYQIVEETASTARDVEGAAKAPIHSAVTTAPKGQSVIASRPDRFLAGVVLAVALGASSPTGVVEFVADTTKRRRDETISESATSLATECDLELLAEIRNLFARGATEFFEDGIQSVFTRTLMATLLQHGRAAFRAIAEYLVTDEPSNPDVISEALRWIGEVKDASTVNEQWVILRRSLKSSSPRVRDGAILGFAALDDPRATSLLLESRNVEQIVELRRLLDQVIAQLHATANVAAAAHGPRKPLA